MENVLKNILFVSYLKNKGVRRICYILGGIPLILSLILFFIEGNKTPGFVLFGIIGFYVPFFIAALMAWVYNGFKDNISVPKKRYYTLIIYPEVILNPDYEFDVYFDQQIAHMYAKDYQDGNDTILVYVTCDKNRQIVDRGSINKSTEMALLNQIIGAIVKGTFVNHVEAGESSKNEDVQETKNEKKEDKSDTD